jgi:hypothetical protein
MARDRRDITARRVGKYHLQFFPRLAQHTRYQAFREMMMMTLRRFKFSGFAAGPAALLVSLNMPAVAQTVTIDAFVLHKGEKIPAICFIAYAPPKDICGDIYLRFKGPELRSLRGAGRQQVLQQFINAAINNK